MARTKAFDPQEKLAVAMLLFWQRGYDGTSMQGLVDAMGINRFSIYNTYGDKGELFFQALQLYSTNVFEPMLQPLCSNKPGLQRVQDYFRHLASMLAAGDVRAGCFLQNAVQESAITNEAVRPYVAALFGRLRQGLYDALSDAMVAQEFARVTDAKAGAAFLLMQVQALIVLQRQVPGDQLKSNVEFLLADIRSW